MNPSFKQKLISTYVDLGKILIVSVLNPINDFARHLIEVSGKDPNYVAPKLPSMIRPTFKFGSSIPSWVKESFKDSSKHIINISRTAPVAIKADEPLQVVKGIIDENNDAVSALHKFIKSLELAKLENAIARASDSEELNGASTSFEKKAEPTTKVKSEKKVRSEKKFKSPPPPADFLTKRRSIVTVSKTKKGVFRRVED